MSTGCCRRDVQHRSCFKVSGKPSAREWYGLARASPQPTMSLSGERLQSKARRDNALGQTRAAKLRRGQSDRVHAGGEPTGGNTERPVCRQKRSEARRDKVHADGEPTEGTAEWPVRRQKRSEALQNGPCTGERGVRLRDASHVTIKSVSCLASFPQKEYNCCIFPDSTCRHLAFRTQTVGRRKEIRRPTFKT